MKKMLLVGIILVLSIGFSGCGPAQVQNVPKQALATNQSKITNDDVFKSILRAGAGLGWIIKAVDENTAEGTLHLRDHTAVVTISYNTKDYSITYKTSTNLGYDAENNTIHSNYNGWITNLNRAIQVQLSTL